MPFRSHCGTKGLRVRPRAHAPADHPRPGLYRLAGTEPSAQIDYVRLFLSGTTLQLPPPPPTSLLDQIRKEPLFKASLL
ncbi:hypothetical protein [Granulicella sp. L60]|uniref:hypothetical protein n=1 Tax=Granulicella sp. L60 TaxID=1641866 RepID=UPI00131D16E6|nr:hypothetical protein [Granulicella sp. L60]